MKEYFKKWYKMEELGFLEFSLQSQHCMWNTSIDNISYGRVKIKLGSFMWLLQN